MNFIAMSPWSQMVLHAWSSGTPRVRHPATFRRGPGIPSPVPACEAPRHPLQCGRDAARDPDLPAVAARRARGVRLHLRPRRGDSVDGAGRPRAGHALAGPLPGGGGAGEPSRLSQGRLGGAEALPRILALLRLNEIHASFFVPAWVAEKHPDAGRAIVDGGHELGCHGDEHEKVSDLPAEREEAILLKSVEVLTRVGGKRPLGYRAPAWQLYARTLERVGPHRFDHSSNMMDRLSPYLHPAAGGRALVEIPVSW